MGDRYNGYPDRGDSHYRPRDDFRGPPPEYRGGGGGPGYYPPESSRGGYPGGGGYRHDDRRDDRRDDHRRGGDRGGGFRVYVGDLPREIYIRDVEDVFRRFGRIRHVDVKPGFAFIEFSDDRDAQDAVRELHGRDVFGRRIRVEFAKAPRDRERTQEVRQRVTNPDCRVLVTGLTLDTSWQDLKDLGREAGNVTFADVTKVGENRIGVLEFENKDMAQAAIRKLDGAKLKGNSVKAEEETAERTFRSLVDASRGQARREREGNGSNGSGANSGPYGTGSSSSSGAYGASEGSGAQASQAPETSHPADDTSRRGGDAAESNQDGAY